jgi:nucleoside-diphosphate-sugar epimerase
MTSSVLLIGGSGPTGPLIAAGLSDLDHKVTILHRGVHEAAETEGLEHIHADPHFAGPLRDAVVGRTFDVVVATYGRLAAVAEVFSGRCRQLVAVTGTPIYRGWFGPHHRPPLAMPVRTRETDDLLTEIEAAASRQAAFQYKIRQAEDRVLEQAASGEFSACLLRYPNIYGPRQVTPLEWRIVKRVLDGRSEMIVPENGLAIYTRWYAANASHAVLLAVARPEDVDGQVLNGGDSDQYSLRQWVEMALDHLGSQMQLVSLPDDLAGPARALNPLWGLSTHGYLDTSRLERLLGYQDIVPARIALAETVDWYLKHPPDQPASGPDFDYAYEDRVISRYRGLVESVRKELVFQIPLARHPYAHPREPGQFRDEHGR